MEIPLNYKKIKLLRNNFIKDQVVRADPGVDRKKNCVGLHLV